MTLRPEGSNLASLKLILRKGFTAGLGSAGEYVWLLYWTKWKKPQYRDIIYVNTYDVVENIQFGFCRMRSWPESVLELLSGASDYMDEQDPVAVLCLGFQKSFDDLLPKTQRS